MFTNTKQLPIALIGSGDLAEIAKVYLQDSPYYIQLQVDQDDYVYSHPNLRLMSISNFLSLYRDLPALIAIGYRNNNETRKEIFELLDKEGIQLLNYLSPKCFLPSSSVSLGKANFIFEDNTIQPFVGIGHNNVLWSGNHIGHHTIIGSHNFISSHVVISGHCEIGDQCFIGVNSTLKEGISICSNTIIGAGSLVVKNITEPGVYIGSPARKKD